MSWKCKYCNGKIKTDIEIYDYDADISKDKTVKINLKPVPTSFYCEDCRRFVIDNNDLDLIAKWEDEE